MYSNIYFYKIILPILVDTINRDFLPRAKVCRDRSWKSNQSKYLTYFHAGQTLGPDTSRLSFIIEFIDIANNLKIHLEIFYTISKRQLSTKFLFYFYYFIMYKSINTLINQLQSKVSDKTFVDTAFFAIALNISKWILSHDNHLLHTTLLLKNI